MYIFYTIKYYALIV